MLIRNSDLLSLLDYKSDSEVYTEASLKTASSPDAKIFQKLRRMKLDPKWVETETKGSNVNLNCDVDPKFPSYNMKYRKFYVWNWNCLDCESKLDLIMEWNCADSNLSSNPEINLYNNSYMEPKIYWLIFEFESSYGTETTPFRIGIPIRILEWILSAMFIIATPKFFHSTEMGKEYC